MSPEACKTSNLWGILPSSLVLFGGLPHCGPETLADFAHFSSFAGLGYVDGVLERAPDPFNVSYEEVASAARVAEGLPNRADSGCGGFQAQNHNRNMCPDIARSLSWIREGTYSASCERTVFENDAFGSKGPNRPVGLCPT